MLTRDGIIRGEESPRAPAADAKNQDKRTGSLESEDEVEKPKVQGPPRKGGEANPEKPA
jgi:hypothetical protein